jgi:hypothetical protein
MRTASAVMAIIAGILTFLVSSFEIASAHPSNSLLIDLMISVMLIASALCSMFGRLVWLLPAVWAGLTVCFVVRIVVTDPDMSLMHGGLFVFAMFIYLLVGFGLSFRNLRPRRPIG